MAVRSAVSPARPIGLDAEAGLGRHTCLYDLHAALGARIVEFGGWDMPVSYGSQIEEHRAVRQAAGVFDVSHMCIADLHGARTRELLRRLLANDVARLAAPGKALYSCMLNERGGVLDDLIVYFLSEDFFRLVVNAGTRDKDLSWIRAHAGALGVQVLERTDLAMLAVQGPQARERVAALLAASDAAAALALPVFCGVQLGEWFVARTGYTGEDGFELMLPTAQAVPAWQRLNAAGVRSCGLGARDTLRLEAGMNLYGNDMDEQTNPLESGLAWTVAFEPAGRDFVGRASLEAVRAAGPARRLVGLVLEERAILRAHQRVLARGVGEGEVTSGTFSPTLSLSIGLARVPAASASMVEVEVRGQMRTARVVRPPFVRHGKALIGPAGSVPEPSRAAI
jgi:aminomethyltransferase